MRNTLPVLVTCFCLLFSGAAHAEGEQDVLVAQVDSDGVQRIRIVGGEYFFKPRHVVVKANVPVELLLSKEAGIVPHSFAIDAPQAGVVVNEDLDTNVKKVTFTPTAAGTYPYYCRQKLLFFKSHQEKGMEGVLEVTP